MTEPKKFQIVRIYGQWPLRYRVDVWSDITKQWWPDSIYFTLWGARRHARPETVVEQR